jgi:hypothetical protein
MIEIAPELMEALQAEAERQGKTVSEIASKAIKEWIDPEPWFDINEPMEPARRVELPIEGATYRAGESEFHIRVVSLRPLCEPSPPPPTVVTIAFQAEYQSDEWEQQKHQVYGEEWMDLVEEFGLTLESASNPELTGLPTA